MQIKNIKKIGIYIQEININDVTPTYIKWLNDPSINQFLETRFNEQNFESIQKFVQSTIDNPNEHLFSIRTTCTNKHIGNIKIGSINRQHHLGYISLFIGDKTQWGKNYAVQAIQLISRYAIEYLLLRKLVASAYKPNIASIKVFTKAGYQQDAILKSHYILDGVPCDLISMSFFNKDVSILPNIEISNGSKY